MKAGISTACLYPRLLEESFYDLAVNGVDNIEIFFNTDCELRRGFVDGLSRTARRFDAEVISVHPFTCQMEPMMFFSAYERRVGDILEYYKKYFDVMNRLGASFFVFHGSKAGTGTSHELYFERYSRLYNAGRENGITVLQENVVRCDSGKLSFLKEMLAALGDEAKFVLDVKQAVRAQENPFDYVKVLGDSIKHVHISDNSEKGDCLPLGKGRFDIRRFISELSSKGFDGSVIIELYRSNFETISDLLGSYTMLKKIIEKNCKDVIVR